MLWCAVGLILLIVCVNLSNLLLARAAARSKEFAMRRALGAGRGRLVRQLLTESLVLAAVGALLGLGLAYVILSYLAHQGSIALPLLAMVRVDGTVLEWTLFDRNRSRSSVRIGAWAPHLGGQSAGSSER